MHRRCVPQVRNWAAGLNSNWTQHNSHFEGFHAVEQAPDNKTIGLVSMANGGSSLVELPDDGRGLQLIFRLPGSVSVNLERGCVLRYAVSHFTRGSQKTGVQEIWGACSPPATPRHRLVKMGVA
jgi:hypothetical protein